MAAGVPVVTTRAGALPETVGDAADARRRRRRRRARLRASPAVLARPARRASLMAKGRERAARYSWERPPTAWRPSTSGSRRVGRVGRRALHGDRRQRLRRPPSRRPTSQQEGDEVIGIDRDLGDVDITDPARRVVRASRPTRPEVVYHLAGCSDVGGSWTAPLEAFRANADGTLNVLSPALESGVGRVLVVSSADMYGIVTEDELPIAETAPLRPVSPYAASKVAADFLGLQAWLGLQARRGARAGVQPPRTRARATASSPRRSPSGSHAPSSTARTSRGRQPGAAPRLHRRARRRPGLPAARRARRARRGLQRVQRPATSPSPSVAEHPAGAWRGGPCGCATDPGVVPAGRRPRHARRQPPAPRRDRLEPRRSRWRTTLADLLADWRRQVARPRRCSGRSSEQE